MANLVLNYDVPTFLEFTSRQVFKLVRDKHAWSVKNWRHAILEVKNECGNHPYLSFLEARWLHQRELKNKIRAVKKRDHLMRQKNWFSHERAKHYLKLHRFGTHHLWFKNRIFVETGCWPQDVDYEEEDWSECDDEEVQTHSYVRRHRCHCGIYSCEDDFCGAYVSVSDDSISYGERPRNGVLLARLRYLRKHGYGLYKVVSKPIRFTPQMMEPTHDESLNTIKTGNVVLTESNPSEPVVTDLPLSSSIWQDLSSAERQSVYDYLTDRFTYYKTVNWTTQSRGKLNTMHLPVDFVTDGTVATGTMPILLPFKVHRFVETDIEIKIHINSNRFQTGMLQVSWLYLQKYFKTNECDNVFTRSVLPHVIISAGSSNEVTLTIPYKYLTPYMQTGNRPNALEQLYLGTLETRVLGNLLTSDTGPTTANLTYYIRFPNCKFTAMRDGTIAEPEMMPAMASMAALKVMDRVIGDTNCDNPTSNIPPQYIVPTASHSWSMGTGLVEPLHSLRLNAQTLGTGRQHIDNSNTRVNDIARIYGLVMAAEWDSGEASKNTNGFCLWCSDAHPQLIKTQFNSEDTDGTLQKYSIPPVTFISSLYQYWRGGLNFRFDFAVNSMYAGRLLIAYIPGVQKSATCKITLQQARNCPHAVWDLQDSNTFTFNVPYLADKPWWLRKYGGPQRRTTDCAPSSIYVFVLNPLITMESVSKKINFFIYMCGAEDFEVSVPVQPAIGRGLTGRTLIGNDKKACALVGQFPYRATYWNGFYSQKKLILYYGTDTFGSASHFYSPEAVKKEVKITQAVIWKCDEPDKTPTIQQKKCIQDKNTKQYSYDATTVGSGKVAYIVLWPDAYNFAIPFLSVNEPMAKVVASMLARAKPVSEIEKFLPDFIADSPDSSVGNPYFTPDLFDSLDFIPQGEDRIENPQMLMPVSSVPRTLFGQFTFNENFGDMKDLCRRYQLYASSRINIPANTSVDGEAFMQFPVIPSGLDLDITNPNEIWNTLREGAIPLIASGYVFFRGSIRLRIVFSTDSTALEGATIWVQHHPDMRSDYGRVIRAQKSIVREDLYCNHNYGFYVQAMNVNNIIEVEVPFYQPGMYGFNHPIEDANFVKDIADYVSLGDVVIGASIGKVSKAADVNVDVYYSIGDDFSFSTFKGFGKVIFCDNIWPAREHGDHKKLSFDLSDIVIIDSIPPPIDTTGAGSSQQSTFNTIKNTLGFKPQMMTAVSSFFGNYLGSKAADLAANGVAGTVDKCVLKVADRVVDNVRPDITNLVNALDNTNKQIKESTSDWFKTTAMTAALGQLFHIMNNPTAMTLAISVCNILLAMIGGGISIFISLKDSLFAFFSKYWDLFSGRHNLVRREVGRCNFYPQLDNGEDEWYESVEFRSILGIIFTAIASLLGYVSSSTPAKYFSLIKGFTMTASLCNNIIFLLKNLNTLITWSFKWVITKMDPRAADEALLENAIPEVKAWFKEVIWLLNADVKRQGSYNKKIMDRVFDACVFGSLIIQNNLDKATPSGKIIWDLYKEITKFRNDLIERGVHPDVRFEPFPLYFFGPPGIGKSYLTTDLCRSLLQHINYQTRGPMIYNINPGLKHWSGVQDPAALVSDDMFQVGGEQLERELANLFVICSSCVLNPPMAAVEDKERRLNPLLYIMHSNQAFPNLGTVMRVPEAVYRRRKKLIEVALTPEIEARYPNFIDADQLTANERRNFAHLRFRFAHDQKQPDTEYGDWVNYQTMLDGLKDLFQRHYANERNNFQRRMRDMYALDPDFDNLELIEVIPEIEQTISLIEQQRIFREHIRDRIAEYDDPANQEEQAAFYIRYYRRLAEEARNLFGPQMSPPMPSTSQGVQLDLQDDYLALQKYEPVDNIFVNPDLFESVFSRVRDNTCVGSNLDLDMLRREDATTQITRILCLLSISPTIATNYIDNNFIENTHPADWRNFGMLCDSLFSSMNCHGKTAGTVPLTDIRRFCYFFAELDLSAFNDTNPLELHRPDIVDTDDAVRDMLLVGLQNDYTRFRQYLGELLQDTRRLYIYCEEMTSDNREAAIKFVFMILSGNLTRLFSEAEVEGMSDREKKALIARNLKNLIAYLEYLTKEEHKCCHRRIFTSMLKDMHGVCYNKRLDQFTYSNAYGLKQFVSKCTCNSLCSNPVFWRFFTQLYNNMNKSAIERGIKIAYNNDNTNWTCRIKEYEGYLDTISVSVQFWWKNYVSPVIGETLTFIITWLPTILVVLHTLYRMYGNLSEDQVEATITKTTSGLDEEDIIGSFETQGTSGNYYKFERPKHSKPTRPRPTPATKTFTAQGGQTQFLQLVNKVERNTVFLAAYWLEDGKPKTIHARCLAIYERKILVLRHYMEEFSRAYKLDNTITFELLYNVSGKQSRQTIYPEELFDNVMWANVKGTFSKSNFGIVSMPRQVCQFPNILSSIATKAMHDKVTTKVDFISIGGESVYGMTVKKAFNYNIEPSDYTSEVILDTVYSYDVQGKGMCGSVLIGSTLCSGNGGIFGMHVAGNGSYNIGLAEPMYREMFETVKSKDPALEVKSMNVLPLSDADVDLDSNMLLFGCVPSNMAHCESGKTKIIPSIVAGKIYPVITQVNPLKKNDPRQPPGSDPLRDGCLKHGSGVVKSFPPIVIKRAVLGLSEYLNQIIKPLRLDIRPLSLEEAVCGIQDIPYFEALNWKSSEGFPLNKSRPNSAHDKRWLFELNDTEHGYTLVSLHPKLLERLALRDKCFKENVALQTIHEDCLKDYRLSPEKCRLPGSTRIFSIAPVECTIQIRQYLGDFLASFKNSRIVNQCGIGINPDSMEWTQLVHYLHEVGDNIITIDYKNFGPTLISQVVVAAIDIILSWHEFNGVDMEHIRHIKYLLENDILNPIHLCSNVVYQTINGISSGSPVTGELNSICNMVYVLNAWVILMANTEFASVSNYFENVRLVVYGDDLIMSVSDKVKDYFNAITIQDCYVEFGLTITSADKGAELKPYDTILYATFLKRGFMSHPNRPGVWLGPVDKKSVEECVNWMVLGDDKVEGALEHMRASCDLAYSHGPIYYEMHKQKLIKALIPYNAVLNVPSWLERDRIIFGDGDVSEYDIQNKRTLPWYYYVNES